MRLVRVYKSLRKQDMYLFVDFREALARVPASLLTQFGEPSEVMTLKLTPERKLARARATDVLEQIDTAGFYLQMPPPEDERNAL